MTEPTCLHTTRVRAVEVRHDRTMDRTLYAERCVACSTLFRYTLDTLTKCYPDGTEEVSEH